MSQISSALIVGPLWQKFMIEILKDIPEESFKASTYSSEDKGNLKPVLRGVWQTNDGIHSILKYVNKDEPRGDEPRNPSSDPQFDLWETGVRNWAIANSYANNPINEQNTDNSATSTESSN